MALYSLLFYVWKTLLPLGLAPSDIHASQLCTATHPDLFCSYRRDGKGGGRIAGVIRRRV